MQPIDIEPPISPPILLPMTSQPTPAPRLVQTDKPHPLATALPSTTMLHTDDFELTSFDPEPRIKAKSSKEQKKSTLDYVQKAALQLYQQDKIPWRRYVKHLKHKQKKKQPTIHKELSSDWVTDLSDVTTQV